ncbi:CD36 family [Popillia japonica]|uniref:Sensory neuron membrane protein 2 n=1 Tax=Popillia japonica TaxID=7064 RepID=A0AAW1HRK3_POPJA
MAVTIMLGAFGAVLGVCLLGTGLFLGYSKSVTHQLEQEVAKETRLEKGTEQYERWKNQPLRLVFKIYLFNVTNPDEIRLGAAPIVREIGPLVYEKYFYKKEIPDESSDILRYNQYLRMSFMEDLSFYSDDLKITFLNLPLRGVYDEEEGNLATENKTVAPENLWSDDVFATLPIKDLQYYKFCDTHQKEENSTTSDKRPESQTSIAMFIYCNQVKDVVPFDPTIKTGSHRGFMFDDYLDGQYQISAGMKDIRDLGKIRAWNGKRSIETWAGDNTSKCNKLQGTDSTIYAPGAFSNPEETFFTFSTEICRTIKYRVVEEVEFKGIPGLKAVVGPENMENEGENSCYCIKKTPDIFGRRDCFPKGFCDMGNCLNAPVVLSLPHMLWADEAYRNTVMGLEANKEKHMSFVSVDPITGTLLQSRKRMQYNVPLRPVDAVNATKNFQPAMLPVLWVEETFDMPDNMTGKVRSHYIDKLYYLHIMCFVLIGIGIIGGSAMSIYLLFPRF